MKNKKILSILRKVKIMKVSIAFSVIFAALIFLFPVPVVAGDAENNRISQIDYSNYEELLQRSSSGKNVKVIVKLSVPGIKQLTAQSTGFCTVEPGLESIWGGAESDMALMDAIAHVAGTVLDNLSGTEYRLNHIYSSIPYLALDVSIEAMVILQNLPEVLDIEEDKPVKLIDPFPGEGGAKGENNSSDTSDLSQPMLDNTVSVIGADTAWGMRYTGSGWYVAILDTGIRSTHEFFSGKTIVEACYALGEDGVGPVGDCPNGNTSMTGPGSALHHPSTYDGHDHGTHVSGIAAGNYGSLFGVAKNANIIAVQVFSKFSASSCGSSPCVMTWNSDSLAGLNYIYSIRGSYSIASVNMSLGGGGYSSPCDSDSRKAAIDNLRSVGIATAIATGNNGYCGYVSSPACISTCVSVGSSTDSDQESYFNNWHQTMQRLFAPGSSVYSSTGSSDSSYSSWSGTSMATPHVAGAWALLKQAHPSGTVTDLLTALQGTGVGITSVCDGHTVPIPRIQVDSAIISLGGTITVTAPNGYEEWAAGSVNNITWTSTGIVGNLKIEYSTDNGDNWTEIIASTENDGSFPWDLPDVDSTQCLVRVSETDGSPADTSDNVFTIYTSSVTVTSPNGYEEWAAGSQHYITWTSIGTVGSVKIEYSIEDSDNWTEITASTENDGSYPWDLPDVDSTQCLVRVSETDGSPTDTSDNVFTIFPPSTTVTSPNGYENWEASSLHNITWTSLGAVGNVKIEYSIDNGDNWTEIIASTENDGSFPWNLPDVESNQCLVRVSETDGNPTDTGDNVFTVFHPSVTVTSPNGGENWQVNSQHPVTWISTGTVGNVKIDYSTDNGDNWTEVTPSTANDGSFPWTVPDAVSDQCLIRVSETDGTPSDTGDNVFSIRPVSSITVTSPNGGENLDMGTVHDIAWTSEGDVGNVRIEYSINGGNSWEIIVLSTENDGGYNWTVPAKPSGNCLVRISETDEDGTPSDVSDAVFFIVSPVPGSITVRSPNGGESYLTGSTQEIKWNSTGDINSVTIKYSTDNGTTWKVIAQTITNSHSYNWDVPGTVSDECLVRVTAADIDMDPKPSDVSDAVFSIALSSSTPAITVTAPNGGEQLIVGSTANITWNGVNSRENVQIEYSIDGGQGWTTITGAVDNNGDYEWLVPDTPSTTCLVRVGETGGPSDISDVVFSIVQPSPGDIAVTSPNGGESWTAGSSQEIAWTSNGGINNVIIEYSTDTGTTWKEVVQITANDGSFYWTVPETVSDECLVRITANDGGSEPIPSDISDQVFFIVLSTSTPTITVTAPNGGEQLIVGSTTNITWNAVNIEAPREDVQIEYSTDSGQNWTPITEAVDNNGDYEWLVPGTPSETCLVRVSETDGQPLDISDAVFSIVQPSTGDITVTSPNGGESWTEGSSQEITWTASGDINNVSIEYSADTGTTWKSIVQTTANNGSFDWNVPGTVSDECLVRVTANDGDLDPIPSDKSDQVFSIVPDSAGEFRVTSPNGGEEWEVGSTQSITWIGSGDITNVTIEYSPDNGNTWSTIAASAGNSGTYNWTVPDTVSAECLVRVTANDGGGDPKPSDVSDELFSIVLPSSPTITVLAPNGGEELVIGSLYQITWFSTDTREDVQIEYSIDGGDTWTGIVSSTENDGGYDWTIPGESSEICLVRISETDGQPVDVSDAVFSIVQPSPGTLTVTAPNGGENLGAGTEFDITWTGSGFNNVVIEYSTDNGVTWITIDTAQGAGGGIYTWVVPETPSETCLVQVTASDTILDPRPSDVSDQVFSIVLPSPGAIRVDSPNGGETLATSSQYDITWTSTEVDNVLIEYSTDNGAEWIYIDTAAASGGSYPWTVPGTASDSCLIRITGNDPGENPSDVSDAVFSIL